MSNQNKETLGFQTEVKQLLDLMIHSLYSNKEIFLRELISNASDAADKLRFEALHNKEFAKQDPNLAIKISFDKDANTIQIADNGIGMSRNDAIKHLGTIAKSGTSDFLKRLTGDQKKDSQLIGKFGVGFYSSFIVADKVTVETLKAGETEAVKWESDGSGEFTIETISKPSRGTTITLHLKPEANEFADDWRLRSIIRKYSDHISLPILMHKVETPTSEEDEKNKEEVKTPKEIEWETVNTAKALWTRSRKNISDEEYKEFYKHISHDFSEPLSWSHNSVEGKLEYTSMLFIPSKAPFDMYNREMQKGLKLYIKRVFIMDKAEEFLPMYLRFIKGIVDSSDLPLNISREILQKDHVVSSMKSALTKRVLDMLTKMAANDKDNYAKFWAEFGQVLKEGPAEDFANKEKIAKLLRFCSTKSKGAAQDQSLEEYIAHMKADQEKIYYITAETHKAAANSPHLEVFKKKNIEVLLLSDRVDEWLISSLRDFNGKAFADIGRGELDLGKLDSEEDKQAKESSAKEKESLLKRITEVLKDQVEKVQITHRLTESPGCLVINENDMGIQMRRIMEASGQSMPETKPIFEINPNHPLITRLDKEPDEDRFAELCHIIFDQSNLAAGGKLDDPGSYVKRLNKLIVEMAD